MTLNDYEVANLVDRLADRDDLPNTRRAAVTLARLVEWTNRNSDGWAYWPKPDRASRKLQEVLQIWERNYWAGADLPDLPEADLRRLFAPIKSFLTRQGVDHDLIFRNDHRSIFAQEA